MNNENTWVQQIKNRFARNKNVVVDQPAEPSYTDVDTLDLLDPKVQINTNREGAFCDIWAGKYKGKKVCVKKAKNEGGISNYPKELQFLEKHGNESVEVKPEDIGLPPANLLGMRLRYRYISMIPELTNPQQYELGLELVEGIKVHNEEDLIDWSRIPATLICGMMILHAKAMAKLVEEGVNPLDMNIPDFRIVPRVDENVIEIIKMDCMPTESGTTSSIELTHAGLSPERMAEAVAYEQFFDEFLDTTPNTVSTEGSINNMDTVGQIRRIVKTYGDVQNFDRRNFADAYGALYAAFESFVRLTKEPDFMEYENVLLTAMVADYNKATGAVE